VHLGALWPVVVVDEEQGTAVRADVVRGQVLGSPAVEAGERFGDDLVACGSVGGVGESGELDRSGCRRPTAG
jgi:hypothetical protein